MASVSPRISPAPAVPVLALDEVTHPGDEKHSALHLSQSWLERRKHHTYDRRDRKWHSQLIQSTHSLLGTQTILLLAMWSRVKFGLLYLCLLKIVITRTTLDSYHL